MYLSITDSSQAAALLCVYGKKSEIQALPPLSGDYLSQREERKTAQSYKASFPPAFSRESEWEMNVCLIIK